MVYHLWRYGSPNTMRSTGSFSDIPDEPLFSQEIVVNPLTINFRGFTGYTGPDSHNRYPGSGHNHPGKISDIHSTGIKETPLLLWQRGSHPQNSIYFGEKETNSNYSSTNYFLVCRKLANLVMRNTPDWQVIHCDRWIFHCKLLAKFIHFFNESSSIYIVDRKRHWLLR